MRRIRLRSIVMELALTGVVSLGGGRTAYFYDSLVARRRWLSTEEFVQDLTLSQILPGPNASNLAVALGWRLGGWAGAAWGLLGYTLSQLTPGPTMLVVVFVGFQAHGLAGAVLAGLGMFLPTSVLTATAARHWGALRGRPWAQAAERALTPIGIGLMAAGGWTLARSALRDRLTLGLAAGALLVFMSRWRVPPIAVVLAAGVVGWLAAP